jgi:hypothetical protein
MKKIKKIKKNELKIAIGESNLNKLPLYYKTMNERPEQKIIHMAHSANHNGTFFIPEMYYKPISRMFKSIKANDKF